MKKVVMTPNPYRDRNFSCVTEAKRILEQAGIETKVCLTFDVDKNFELPSSVELHPLQEEIRTADAVICFGGDGTILHTSKAAARYSRTAEGPLSCPLSHSLHSWHHFL